MASRPPGDCGTLAGDPAVGTGRHRGSPTGPTALPVEHVKNRPLVGPHPGGELPTALPAHDRGGQSLPFHSALDSPQLQARGHLASNVARGRGPPGAMVGQPPSEAQDQKRGDCRPDNDRLLRVESQRGQGRALRGGDTTAPLGWRPEDKQHFDAQLLAAVARQQDREVFHDKFHGLPFDAEANTSSARRWLSGMMGVGRGESTLPTSAADWAMPLHAKKVETIKIEQIRCMMLLGVRTRFDTLLSYLGDGALLDKLTRAAQLPTSHLEETSTFPASDAATLLANGICEEPADPSTCYLGAAFSVMEHLKGRRRFIYWPRRLNQILKDLLGYKFGEELPEVFDISSDVHKGNFSAAYDLTTSFFQVEIPPEARRFFAFKDENGKVWQMTRMPMGWSVAVEIMHLITRTIAGDAGVLWDALSAPQPKVHVTCFVDNFRHVSTDAAEVDKARVASLARCSAARVTLNKEECNSTLSKHCFCGQMFDFAAKTVCLKTSFVDKLLLNDLATMTYRDLRCLYGRLEFASTVLGISPAKFHWAFKFFRRKMAAEAAGTINLDDPVEWWASARKQFAAWRFEALANRPRFPPTELPFDAPHFLLFTDASSVGYGAVLVNCLTNQISCFGERWEPGLEELHINAKELEAVTRGIAYFRQHFPSHVATRLLIYIDNTTAKRVLETHRTRGDQLHHVLLRFNMVVQDLNIMHEIRYIRTDLMPADQPSRGLPIDDEHRGFALDPQWRAAGGPAWRLGTARPFTSRAAHFVTPTSG